MRIIPVVFLSILGLWSCGESDFAGDGPQKRQNAAPATTTTPTTPTPAANTPPQPTPGTPTPTGVVNPPPASTSLFPSILNSIGKIFQTINNVQMSQPNAGEIIFGGDKVFHIGDNNFSKDSECASQIRAYGIRGTQYFFEFEVTEDQTTVSIDINRICGVDHHNSNTVSLRQGSSNLDQQVLAKAASSLVLTPRVLNRGQYTIVVVSNQAGAQNPQKPDDHDDFIVGDVHISGNKPIKPGRVGAQ